MDLVVVLSRVERIGKFIKTVSHCTDSAIAFLHVHHSSAMDGVDLAFYKNRALYHTKFDSLTYAEGGRKSLQAMIETVRYGGLEMLDAEVTPRQGKKDPVYFDGPSRFAFIVLVLTGAQFSGSITSFGK
jgi:hypothetical protein